jgi:DNA repair exonuclease SbcCD ATPase subunit
VRILQLKVTKSDLFGEELIINFSEKMTCIMGGRGAGKTTILTLVKWCLMDDTLFTKPELNLIKSNLGAGTVEVSVEHKLKSYTFIKNWGDDSKVKDSLGNNVNNVEEILPIKLIDFFSSGSIEQIGTDPYQRIKIIDTAVGSKIEELNRDITILRAEIEKSQSELFYSREEYKKISQEISQLSNSEALLKEAQESLSKNTSNEKEKEEFDVGLERQKTRHLESVELSYFLTLTNEIIGESTQYNSLVSEKIRKLNDFGSFKNKNIEPLILSIKEKADKISGEIAGRIFDLDKIRADLNVYIKATNDRHKNEELQFAEVRKKLESNRELYQKVTNLSESVTKLGILKNKLQETTDKGKALVANRNQMLERLQKAYYEKTRNRVQLAEGLNQILGKDIKIAVMPFGDKTNYENYIREIISLAKMKVTNEHLLWQLSTPAEFLSAINDNKITDLARQLNLSVERIETLGKVISIHDKKYELETIICDDLVNFYLKVDLSDNQDAYRPTEQLSLGQRCTTILPILFSISDIPLIIDQPEDNLDNRFVAETIHNIIRSAKERRQLTFVTHNPNIPVVADSEHNVFISYNNGRSGVSVFGDVNAVKDSIVSLLEGGKEAFIQRKICYGIEN